MKINFGEWCFERLLKEMSDAEAEQILGVKRGDPNIHAVWKKLAVQNHPDNGGDHKVMAQINNARDILVAPPKPSFNRGPQPGWGRGPQQPQQRGPQQRGPQQRGPQQPNKQEIYKQQEQIQEFAVSIGPEKMALIFSMALQKSGKMDYWLKKEFPEETFKSKHRARSALERRFIEKSKSYSSPEAFSRNMAKLLYSELVDKVSYEKIIKMMQSFAQK